MDSHYILYKNGMGGMHSLNFLKLIYCDCIMTKATFYPSLLGTLHTPQVNPYALVTFTDSTPALLDAVIAAITASSIVFAVPIILEF